MTTPPLLPLAALGAVLAQALPASAAERILGPAETLTYEARYLGLPVGRMLIMVGGSTSLEGQSVWPIIGYAKTDPLFLLFPVKDKYVTWFNPETRLTVGNDFSADEAGKRRRERVRFDRQANRASVVRERDGGRDDTGYEIPPGSQDILAAFWTMRGRDLAVGDVEEFPVFTGRKAFSMRVEVAGRERLLTPAGAFDTKLLRVHVQFSGQLESKREMRVFVTDDAAHVPVRFDAEFLLGTLSSDLIGYQKGIAGFRR